MRKLIVAVLLALALTLVAVPVQAQETTYRYNVVGPWVLYNEDGMEFWGAPTGTLGLLDLRSLPEQGTLEGPPGLGFFVMDRLPAGPSYVVLSAGDKTVLLDNAIQSVRLRSLESTWGISIEAITTRGLVWEMFCEEGDPTGLTRWKPLQAGVDGVLRLNLGGYSPVEFRKDNYSGRDYGHLMGSWKDALK